MTIVAKIGAEIRKAKRWDHDAHITDFQVRVAKEGAVLINLKTSEAVLIQADASDDDDGEGIVAQ
jgi:hypothetical protein